MVRPEFEEKSYESAFNTELERDNRWHSFSPGQVAEKRLGVDVLARVADQHPFWAAVNLAHRSGRRVRRRGVPDEVFNIFLQYKTSHYLVGSRAQHHGYFGGPYYRFRTHRPTSQLSTLQRLESSVGAYGHVLYAAPEFHTLTELRVAQREGRVIAESVAVPPSAFLPAHVAYNFRSGIGARFNPDPEDAEVFRATTALNMDDLDSRLLPFEDALSAIYGELEESFPDPERWQDLASEAEWAVTRLGAPTGSFEFLMIAAFTASLGTRWFCMVPGA